jgi:hypothetical protein
VPPTAALGRSSRAITLRRPRRQRGLEWLIVCLPDRRLGRGKMQTFRGSLHVMVRLSTKVRSRDCGATWKEMRGGVRGTYQPTIIRMLGSFRLVWIRFARM